MILIVVLDGLRPDLISPGQMPFLNHLGASGVRCSESHATFPTATRINSASLATGCLPGRHGIVGNELYVRAVDPLDAVSCADHRALEAIAAAEGGRILSVPTLGERLRAAGRRLVAVGSGSPGTTYLLDPVSPDGVVNWAAAWPAGVQAEVVRRIGPLLGEESDSLERTRFSTRALTDYLLPEFQPDVAAVWVTEPDHSQHHHGLGSVEAVAMLREVDQWLEELVARLQTQYSGDLNCIVTSDHGFCTIVNSVNLSEEARVLAAAVPAPLEPGDLVFAGSGLYLHGAAEQHLPEVLAAFGDRRWVGGLFVRDDLVGRCPGALSQSAVGGGEHPRSPHILYAGAWSAEANGAGIPGQTASPSRNMASHGMASPFELNNTLIAWGPAFKEGVTSAVPCAITDIAPTVLHLLQVPFEGLDGRVLWEALAGGPDLAAMETRHNALSGPLGSQRAQVVETSDVRGREYLDRVTVLE